MTGSVALAFLVVVANTAWGQELDVPPGQVHLDDVWCATCHWEQGDDFSLSTHYQKGLLLCNDCHGGDPFQSQPEKAKALETGFIGKPSKEQIADLCGNCHTGPAQFFGQGPHADISNTDNPTCITCHQNHAVFDATLVLMDSTCASCHTESALLDVGRAIQSRLRAGAGEFERVRERFDSMQILRPNLQRIAPLLAGAASSLRQADLQTHALDLELIETQINSFRNDLAALNQALDDYHLGQQQRQWAVVGLWLFIAANVLLLYIKRRQLL